MKFKTVAEAFNFYRTKSIDEMEKRASEIDKLIDTDPEADIEAFNIELRGIKEARENIEIRSGKTSGMTLITGRDITGEEKKSFSRENAADSAEYRSAFYKTLMGKALSQNEKAAFSAVVELRDGDPTYNDSTSAAAVIPTSTLNEVLKKARTIGGLLAECRAFNMPSKIAIPIGTPSANASWHTEGASVDGTPVSLSTVSFDGYEILKIFSISAKVQTMSISAFESYLTDELVACVMGTIGAALVSGNGSGQGTGIESGVTWVKTSGATQNAVEVAAANDVTYSDVVSAVALLKRGYSQGAKWAMNNATLYNVFYGMVDDNGRPVFIADPKNESIGKILGFDVIIDDNISANVAYLGNFKKYMGYNMPQGITIESSRQSSFKSGLIDYRALAIADCKPLITEAFVKLYKAAS